LWEPTAKLAREFTVAQGTIRGWIRAGKLRSLRVGRSLRVSREDFERLLSKSSRGTTAALSPEELADRDEVSDRRRRAG
jgi:excisionase family DNA binding protein